MRHALTLARQARERGNQPFGAVLVGADGRVLAEGENTVASDRDITGHAETNLLREAYRTVDSETMATSTLYASGEPCPMCAGTIFWSGVGRVVFGVSGPRIRELSPAYQDAPALRLSCREVLAAGTRSTEVIGPVLGEEAERLFREEAG
jgi:tRNA(Arg) A34 adenosine deaminase TadA